MKKITLIVLLLMLFISFGAIAHPPKKIKLNFNKETKMLTADIIHKVKDVDTHYISSITIYINGEEIITKAFENQSDKMDEKLEFVLDKVKSGDVIKFKAKCNKFGKKTAKYTVE